MTASQGIESNILLNVPRESSPHPMAVTKSRRGPSLSSEIPKDPQNRGLEKEPEACRFGRDAAEFTSFGSRRGSFSSSMSPSTLGHCLVLLRQEHFV